MRVDSIRLINFRNYVDQDISFHEGTNLFFGDNAQGKTNVLEGVFLCGTTKSHRGARDRDMIRFGQEEAHIRMQITKKDIPYRIDMHLKKNKAKGIAINGVPIRKAGELIGLGNFVFFSPEDLNIIKNGPSERRRFVDMELCQLSPVYLHELAVYNRALMQRNKLLKDLSFRPDYMETLDVWDEQLCVSGKKIISMRREFIGQLNEIISGIHGKLSGGREILTVGYEENVNEDSIADEMRKSRERDVKLKITHTGPHRDDLAFRTEKVDIRKFGSQGQQRTTALSVKLSEIELVKRVTGDVPVLLLDDVLSELDQSRQHFLLESIENIQTLITCTGVDEYRKNHFRIDRLLHVNDGKVWEDSNG